MNKIIRIGKGQYGNVFCHITFENDRLSITGVEGPTKDGNCRGGCGQIVNTKIIEFAPNWNQELLDKFYQVWEDWHLNDMRAGCEHQRQALWHKLPIDPNKPLNAYGKHFQDQKHDSWNMLTWVTEKEYPAGLLSKLCPICGYKYGSQWLKEVVPDEIINFLDSLPTTDLTPAWI